MRIFTGRSHESYSEKKYVWLLCGMTGVSALGMLIQFTGPENLPVILIFFLLIFCITFSFTYFFTCMVRRSVLAGFCTLCFFLLRSAGLREPIYLLLLGCLVISLELYFQKR